MGSCMPAWYVAQCMSFVQAGLYNCKTWAELPSSGGLDSALLLSHSHAPEDSFSQATQKAIKALFRACLD